MNSEEFDILQSSKDLKKTPFTTPEGYFETLKAEARKCTEPQQVHVSIWARLAPYAAVAAMFLFVFMLGKIFIREKQDAIAFSPAVTVEANECEDYLVYNGIATDISIYYLSEEYQESEMPDESDIIEYLIYTGTPEEYIEYYKQQ